MRKRRLPVLVVALWLLLPVLMVLLFSVETVLVRRGMSLLRPPICSAHAGSDPVREGVRP